MMRPNDVFPTSRDVAVAAKVAETICSSLLALALLVGVAHSEAERLFFDDWTLYCDMDRPYNGSPCMLGQTIRSTNVEGFTLTVIVTGRASEPAKASEHPQLLRVIGPLGLDMQGGIALRVDEVEIGRMIGSTCGPQGCIFEVPLRDDIRGLFKKGREASFLVSRYGKSFVRVPMSLSGITHAYMAWESRELNRPTDEIVPGTGEIEGIERPGNEGDLIAGEFAPELKSTSPVVVVARYPSSDEAPPGQCDLVKTQRRLEAEPSFDKLTTLSSNAIKSIAEKVQGCIAEDGQKIVIYVYDWPADIMEAGQARLLSLVNDEFARRQVPKDAIVTQLTHYSVAY